MAGRSDLKLFLTADTFPFLDSGTHGIRETEDKSLKRFPLFFQRNSYPQKMESRNGIIYEFAGFRLIPGEGLLLQDGEPIPLSLKAFATLALLVERHGHLVKKAELIEEVWENAFVEEAAVSRCVWNIRTALGEDSKSCRFIQTVPRRGYRFVFPVSVVTDRSGAFRLADLHELDECETVFPEEQKPITNRSAGGVSVSTNGATDAVPAADQVEELRERVRLRKRSSSFFPRWVMLAGLVAIVVVTALLGYYVVRKSSAGSTRSIAVLPVAPLNPADGNQLLKLGIADSLINYLSSAEGVNVRQLHAVAGYAEAPTDAITAGREQKADYVLDSKYQIADGKIKITSQLYNVRTGEVENNYQIVQIVADVFTAQDAIAAHIGGQLMQFLGTSARIPIKKRGTNNPEAYLAYVQGMYLLDRLSPILAKKDDRNSLEFFENAVRLDPNYAKAWAGKAMAHNREAQREGDRNSEHLQRAREAVDKALYLDPKESLAYTALCNRQLFSEWNYSASDETCRRAVELDPASSFARSEYGVVLTSRGQFGKAIDQLQKAMETDPTFRVQAFLANALYLARRYEEAEAHYKGLVELKPERPATYSWLVRVCEAQGKEVEAFEWTVKLMIAADKGDEAIQRYQTAYQDSGYRGALLERINIGTMPAPAYVYLGDKDRAFEALEERYRRRNYNLPVYDMVDPLYDTLRGDPRWTDLVRRVQAGGN